MIWKVELLEDGIAESSGNEKWMKNACRPAPFVLAQQWNGIISTFDVQ
jgi:hypothetical protein